MNKLREAERRDKHDEALEICKELLAQGEQAEIDLYLERLIERAYCDFDGCHCIPNPKLFEPGFLCTRCGNASETLLTTWWHTHVPVLLKQIVNVSALVFNHNVEAHSGRKILKEYAAIYGKALESLGDRGKRFSEKLTSKWSHDKEYYWRLNAAGVKQLPQLSEGF